MVKLTSIKIVHTIIWVFFNLVIWYLLAVVVNKIGSLVWIGVGIILAEGLVLILFKMKCPLTIMARKHSQSTEDNFDIYLPAWLAKYNKLIYTIVFIVILCLLAYRMINNNR